MHNYPNIKVLFWNRWKQGKWKRIRKVWRKEYNKYKTAGKYGNFSNYPKRSFGVPVSISSLFINFYTIYALREIDFSCSQSQDLGQYLNSRRSYHLCSYYLCISITYIARIVFYLFYLWHNCWNYVQTKYKANNVAPDSGLRTLFPSSDYYSWRLPWTLTCLILYTNIPILYRWQNL